MLSAHVNAIDSEAAGGVVVEVNGLPNGEDLQLFEACNILPLAPRVAFFPVAAENVTVINRLEHLGYRFAETQLLLSHRIRPVPEAARYPYRFEEITAERDLARPLELAGSIFEHDRFTTDPAFGRGVSGRRYQAYVKQSFNAANERVFVMRHVPTGDVVSFATIRETAPDAIRLLIGGVANELKGSGIGAIHEYVALQSYFDRGYRSLTTAVSAINLPILNLEIRHLGFRVIASRVITRKHFV